VAVRPTDIYILDWCSWSKSTTFWLPYVAKVTDNQTKKWYLIVRKQ